MLHEQLTSTSFLEFAFLRWVLSPAVAPGILPYVVPQQPVTWNDHTYRIDYALRGPERFIAIELDGFEFHGSRQAFSYDRLRQNDLHAAGWLVVRFSYDSIRRDTARCVEQLQAVIALEPVLASFINGQPLIESPQMDPSPLFAFSPSPRLGPQPATSRFQDFRQKLNISTLRDCQRQAFIAIGNAFSNGSQRVACVMSVGAGKTALGVAACLAYSQKRALTITPGSVIRGAFDKACDPEAVGNVLYGLPGGPLISGCKPPTVRTLDRDEQPIRAIRQHDLLGADVIITNFHSLGTGQDPDDLLTKLNPEDIDFIVIDEAHIAAADSYQRALRHFSKARVLLMSACFQRLDGKPIEADVVYRYRLIDSIMDGHAKQVRVQRFAPEAEETTYEMIWPDGRHEEIMGRAALLELINDERKIARITAKSDASIRQVMRATKRALDRQAQVLAPIKPRVLFSALGERHAEQIARIAEEHGIPCSHLHHSMPEHRIQSLRARFEQDSGDLQGLVQLKMLGQGYDFPPITVVVPLRVYGSFSEFYQFIGRGIRVLQHPALKGRVTPGEQLLDIIYHAELGLDDHFETLYDENELDPVAVQVTPEPEPSLLASVPGQGPGGHVPVAHPDAVVLFEQGTLEQRLVHDQPRIEQRRSEREQEAMAQRYALYVQTTDSPIPFEQFLVIVSQMNV